MHTKKPQKIKTPQNLFHYVSSLECMKGVRTLNLTKGCQLGCVYCYIYSYRDALPYGHSIIYPSLIERVEDELSRMRSPQLFLSSSSDIMQPILLQSGITQKIISLINKYKANTSIWTKGSPYLNGKLRYPNLFNELRDQSTIHFEINITSTDNETLKKLEPGTPILEDRLLFAKHLSELGVPTSVRLDPLIPGLTDTEENFSKTMQLCGELNIKEVFYSWLFLRKEIIKNMESNLGKDFEQVKKYYTNEEKQYLVNKEKYRSGVMQLPSKEYRETKIQVFKTIADSFEINTHFCQCKNSDLRLTSKFCHKIHDSKRLQTTTLR